MVIETKRVEIRLDTQTLNVLADLATKDKRSIKNYIEKILGQHVIGMSLMEAEKRIKDKSKKK